jgi:hypothetical protein
MKIKAGNQLTIEALHISASAKHEKTEHWQHRGKSKT